MEDAIVNNFFFKIDIKTKGLHTKLFCLNRYPTLLRLGGVENARTVKMLYAVQKKSHECLQIL